MRSLTDWLFRPKSFGRHAINAGVALLGLAFALGWALKVSFPLQNVRVDFSISSGEGTPANLTYGIGGLGVFLLLGGLVVELIRFVDDRRRTSRKRVLVIEGRGLRDGPGAPLVDAVPSAAEGHRELLMLDLRQRVEDGVIVEPARIIPRIEGLAETITQKTSAVDRSDITLVYGGLTAVPFTFLTGVVMDDEGPVLILDWDRTRERWRELNGSDDGKGFVASGFDQPHAGEVVLAVSVSYPIQDENLSATFPSLPVARLTLQDGNPQCHWSEEMQARLAEQFLNAIIELGGRGIRRIHLVLASQNSVAFRLGRAYDKRNLPELVVYQFENGSTPPYPWGVLMPVGGIRRAQIIP